MAARRQDLNTQDVLDCCAKLKVGALYQQSKFIGDYSRRLVTYSQYLDGFIKLGVNPFIINDMRELVAYVRDQVIAEMEIAAEDEGEDEGEIVR